jgi:hypothetical protein
MGSVIPHPLDLAILQHPQQLDLDGGGNIADFIEKYRALVGGLETTHTGAVRAGVSPLDMPEKLALQQVFVQGRTIDLDVGLVAAAAGLVDGPGHQFLAAAAFALNHHRRIGLGHIFDHLKKVEHHRRFAQYAVIAFI